MRDISDHASKVTYKPELSMVYIHDIDGVKYAVATDSFRLAQYKLPDFMQEHMSCGFYNPKAYKEICKAYNKRKQDLRMVMDTVAGQQALQANYSDYSYPDYQKIMQCDSLQPFTGSNRFVKKYFIEFLEMIPDNTLSFGDIKQDIRGLITYQDEYIKLFLMALTK